MSESQNHTQDNPELSTTKAVAEVSWCQIQPQKNTEQQAADIAVYAGWFRKLALPSLIYAILYTVFTYDNEFGIGIPA